MTTTLRPHGLPGGLYGSFDRSSSLVPPFRVVVVARTACTLVALAAAPFVRVTEIAAGGCMSSSLSPTIAASASAPSVE